MKRILVVDNHPVVLGLMAKLLRSHGHQVKTATDGLTALDILKGWVPDVIFVDLVMPNIDGEKLCKIIRKIPELKNVFIAIVSAVAVEENRDVLEFGANTCIAKAPFKTMAGHIMDVLDAVDQGTARFSPGEILGIEHVYARGITQELLSVRDHFEVILGKMSEGILEITAADRVVFANPAALAIINMAEEKVLAKNFISFFDAADHLRIARLLGARPDGPEKSAEEQSVTLGEKEITLEIVPLNDRENKRIVILSDVTERKRMKAQILQAMKQAEHMAVKAEAASRAKSTFLASMSHEIRTPLNSIVGFTDMLLKSNLNEDEIEYAKTIKQSSGVLLSIINDILDFSKIEADRLDLESFDFDLEETVYHTCELIRPQLASKSIELYCRLGNDVPAVVVGDAGRFQQVLINLLGNAAKFTDDGEVELGVAVESVTDQRVMLHVTVRDTGQAIPREKIGMIFGAFQQADSSTTRKYGGTGLGLAICQKISRLMDGDVWAESTPGVGNTFHFTACFGKSRTIANTVSNWASLSGKKILVVDDNRTHLNILRDILVSNQMMVSAASGADAAISAIFDAQHNEGKPFDCCIVDVKANGYEILKQCRGSIPGSSGPNSSGSGISGPAVISCTLPTQRHATACVEVGFDGFLSKPVRRRKLLAMLKRLLAKTKPEEQNDQRTIPPSRAVENRGGSLRLVPEETAQCAGILIAEDNLMSQRLAKSMFTKAGYHVDVANNGVEVVRKYTAAPEKFDMIFMDVQMPLMDGLTATKEIRKWEEKNNRRIPIVAFTANALKGDRDMCLAAGMDDYMAKPIQVDIALDAVRKWTADG